VKAVFDRTWPLQNVAKIRAPPFVTKAAMTPACLTPKPNRSCRPCAVPVSLCFLIFDDQNHGFRKKSNAELFDAASFLFWQRCMPAP
jgi:hypothetical protein